MDSAAVQAPDAMRFDCPEQEAFLHLWRTYDALKAIEDAVFSRHDLTAQQYNALRLLRASRPEAVPTFRLAARLVTRAPDITRVVDRLVQRGLAERSRCERDRRTVRVAITEDGVRLLRQLDADVRDCNRRQLGHLAPADLADLIDLLKKARRPHEPAGSAWAVPPLEHDDDRRQE